VPLSYDLKHFIRIFDTCADLVEGILARGRDIMRVNNVKNAHVLKFVSLSNAVGKTSLESPMLRA
jgi:hypothetical protein